MGQVSLQVRLLAVRTGDRFMPKATILDTGRAKRRLTRPPERFRPMAPNPRARAR